MTIAELIRELRQMDPKAEVHFAYNYGDYQRTEVAPRVESVEESTIVYSDYHSMDRVIDDGEEVSGPHTPSKVVVLK